MRSLALLALLLPQPSLTGASSNFSFVGYLPEWRYEGANWATLSSHLSHLILFSAEPLPTGELTGLDRFPREALLAEARAAAAAHHCQLLLCFGGNGRSGGFSAMVRSPAARARFVAAAAALVAKAGAHGVDINWEYPGYAFGSGYQAEAEVERDYRGLGALARELRAALGADAPLTLAYYPDGCVSTLFSLSLPPSFPLAVALGLPLACHSASCATLFSLSRRPQNAHHPWQAPRGHAAQARPAPLRGPHARHDL
jgi:hypothetical protein